MIPNLQAVISAATSQTAQNAASSSLVQGPVTIEQNLEQASKNEQSIYFQDPFWPIPDTDVTKWDKYCPYQLIVVEWSPNTPGVPSGGGRYKQFRNWQYTLPLPPESMVISMPFAIQGTVTQGGYVEEHNGAPIRHISFRGTTGFLPSRETGATRTGTGAISQLESIFGGTVNTINSAIGSLNQVKNSITGSGPEAYNVYQEASFSLDSNSLLVNTSGFKQLTLLRDFLECYAAAKKKNTDVYNKLRLAVAIWKENQVFLVTPLSFVASKISSEPLEYKYSLDFKGFRRIELDAGNFQTVAPIPFRHSPNLVARAINTLTFARQAVQKMGTLKQAILGDIDYVLKPFHDTILLSKDISGASLSVSDIPNSVKQKVNLNIANLKYSSPGLWNQLTSTQTQNKSIKALKYSLGNVTKLQDTLESTNTSQTFLGQSNAASSTAIGFKPRILSIKDIPDELADQIPISALQINTDIRADILNDITRVKNLRRKDFEDYLNSVTNTMSKIAFLVGAGDPLYADTYGINVQPIKDTPTQSDWDTLNALSDSIVILQQLAATADGEPTEAPSMLDRFGGMAVASGIAWQKPVSKFAIPFPYGATLEGLSALYLKDPNRYMEIIALNGLRSPYIDEVGYVLPLLVNGIDKTIVVNDSPDLYVGKTVWLSSNASNRVQFKIESIQRNSNIVTLKLNDVVSSYKVADNAVLESFLSGTVCSRNLIWIPSDVDPLDPESVITKDIPGVDATDPMVSIGGVDLLLGTDNDLVLVDGELRYAIGLANIVQWVKTTLIIQKGELIQHRELGLPLSIGLSLADFSAQDVMNAIKKQLSQDSMFSRIDKVSVVQNGNAVSISVNAVVAGTSQPLPLNYGMKLAS